jgi:AcrR family transcriptional regulator
MIGLDADMTGEKHPYHHGDLRAALLTAGEAVLSETGIEGFSLRRVARDVGVSHSAPAHHFGDTQGLLAALATEGFQRFLGAMQARQAACASDNPAELLIASGLGYVDFALAAPALFKLMFGSDRVDFCAPALGTASEAAFDHLARDIARLRGVSPYEDAAAMADVMASWSMVHGFASLLLSGRMHPVQEMDAPTREAFFRQVFARVTM